jgi:hypothetical protein
MPGTDDTVNDAQRLNLELIRLASFNAFDGPRVVADLLAHRALWQAAFMKRDDLVPLRDLPEGYWNVDTLYVLAQPGSEAALASLAEGWWPDALTWIEGEDAQRALGSSGPDPQPRILCLWWD